MGNVQKYITKGVSREIPLHLQLFMWKLRADLLNKDYLQVFKLSVNDEGQQVIEHIQEEPEYYQRHTLLCSTKITTKVYIIKDETHMTMLLAEEY